MKDKPLLLLGSTRQTGKDTLCQRLTEIGPFRRFSFADALKDDLSTLISEKMGIYIFNPSPKQKELIRPLLISYGMVQRQRDPDYWVKRLNINIDCYLSTQHDGIPVITDCRFSNELSFFKLNYPRAFFVQVNRKGAPPPTDEEEKHWRALAARADYTLNWGENSVEEQLEYAKKIAQMILQ